MWQKIWCDGEFWKFLRTKQGVKRLKQKQEQFFGAAFVSSFCHPVVRPRRRLNLQTSIPPWYPPLSYLHREQTRDPLPLSNASTHQRPPIPFAWLRDPQRLACDREPHRHRLACRRDRSARPSAKHSRVDPQAQSIGKTFCQAQQSRSTSSRSASRDRSRRPLLAGRSLPRDWLPYAARPAAERRSPSDEQLIREQRPEPPSAARLAAAHQSQSAARLAAVRRETDRCAPSSSSVRARQAAIRREPDLTLET